VERTEFKGRSEGVEKVKDRGAGKEGKGVEGDKGKGAERRESGEAHNVTSESGMDKSRIGESGHP